MFGCRKWGRRVKAELKLVWLVIEDLFGDVMRPHEAAAPVPFAFATMTVSELVPRPFESLAHMLCWSCTHPGVHMCVCRCHS